MREGFGSALVLAVGANSQAGIIAQLVVSASSTADKDAAATSASPGGGAAGDAAAAVPASLQQPAGAGLREQTQLQVKLEALATVRGSVAGSLWGGRPTSC